MSTPSNALNIKLAGLVKFDGATSFSAATVTQYDVLVGGAANAISSVGPGSAGQVLQSSGAGVNPAYSTATYPSTTTASQLLYSSANNTVAGLATANRAVITTSATGVPVATALATDGQLIIGSAAGAPAAATLTQGTGISIVNGSNSITISASGSGLSWTDVTAGTQNLSVSNGYISDNAANVVFTLPASAVVGDVIEIVGKLGLWSIEQNALQQILFGSLSSTVGVTGSIVSTNFGDCAELVCITGGTSTVYRIKSAVGNLNVL